jgi:PKD repeat protein
MRKGIISKKVIIFGIIMLFVGASFLQQNNTTVKADLTDGLVGYWNFDEGSGNILHDSSSYGNDGTIYGNPTWTTGISGNAINFDGINDWVDCGNDASLSPLTAITLAAWYKPTISWSGGGPDPIIDKPINSNDWNELYQYHLSVCGDLYPGPIANHLGISLYIDIDGSYKLIKSPENMVSFNQWSFIVATYDGTTMKLYIDNELISSIPVSGTMTNYNQNLRIAKYKGGSEEIFLPGVIDEIRIYNRALNENEIIELSGIVNQPPTADAGGLYYANIDNAINFDGSGSSDTDGTIVGYRWDFTNDGTYDTGWLTSATTTHSYSSVGTYTVKLQLKDDVGDTSTDTATATITSEGGAVPNTDANGPYSGYVNNPVIFSSSGSVGGSEGTIVSYYWTFGDGTVSSQQNPTHTYTTSGSFSVTLKVTNNYDQIDTDTTTATISDISPDQSPPIADNGGPYSGVVGSPITFDGSGSTDTDGTIVSYLWNFGDSTTGTGVSPTHTYTIPGNYTVILTVTDNDSLINSNSTTVSINVSGPPTITIAIASSNIEPIEEENEKTFSITVQCEHQPVRNIHLEILEQSNLTIISLPSNISLNPGESRELFITIKAPKLNHTNNSKQKVSDETIILRAVGDGNVTSNTEQVNFKVIGKDATPGFETVATITAIGTAGALVTFFRRRNRNR